MSDQRPKGSSAVIGDLASPRAPAREADLYAGYPCQTFRCSAKHHVDPLHRIAILDAGFSEELNALTKKNANCGFGGLARPAEAFVDLVSARADISE
jgi:hypothetical protein